MARVTIDGEVVTVTRRGGLAGLLDRWAERRVARLFAIAGPQGGPEDDGRYAVSMTTTELLAFGHLTRGWGRWPNTVAHELLEVADRDDTHQPPSRRS